MQETTIKEFFDESLRQYSAHSNIRGIPFIGDGFKQSHRKSLYGILKRGENAEKDTVERISAFCASASDYHHGVGSMESTIIGLAQSFAGSNNLPFLESHGQFGSRLSSKASAARYIKTKLSANYRKICRKEDDIILEYLTSSGMTIEPKFFIPLLPMVLINGAEGMGTGHASYILPYNPVDIKAALQKLLAGKTLTPNSLVPWWRGFDGNVSRNELSGQVTVTGLFKKEPFKGGLKITVTELPIGQQSDPYEDHLHKMEDKGLISGFDNASGKNKFLFKIVVPRSSKLCNMSDEELLQAFKLIARDSENLTVWNPQGKIKRYETPELLLKDWFDWRLALYETRRLAQIEDLKETITWASEKIRFINFYLKNTDKFKNTGKADLIKLLLDNQFEEYDRLLGMSIWNLTKDKIAELEKELDDLKKRLAKLNAESANAMFIRELKELDV